MAPPRPPTDRNFDPENGPEQYVDEDDFGIVKDSIALQLTRRGVSIVLGIASLATRLTSHCNAENTDCGFKYVEELKVFTQNDT